LSAEFLYLFVHLLFLICGPEGSYSLLQVEGALAVVAQAKMALAQLQLRDFA